MVGGTDYVCPMNTTTAAATEGTTMTDQTTLDRLIAAAERTLDAAIRRANTLHPSAPLADKVADRQRIQRAQVELDALRELVAE